MNAGVVIPAYNEAERLGSVLSQVRCFVRSQQICVVNDGSTDHTADVARNAGVHCITFPENRGKGAAIKAGFAWILEQHPDAVIVLDADGQHDPVRIPDFIKVMDETQCDVVIGTRPFQPGSMPLDRILSNRLSSLIVSLAARKWITDSQSGFRMIRASWLASLALVTDRFETESEILIRLARKGADIRNCPIEAIYRGESSHIHRWRDTLRFCNLIIRLSFG